MVVSKLTRPSLFKRALSTFGYILFLAIATLGASEICIRTFIDPDIFSLEDQERILKTDPSNFFLANQMLGYTMESGHFQINQNDLVKWESTQNDEGYRITSTKPDSSNEEIWVLGCSFTYGWGVSDNESFPYQLQELRPDKLVRNYGVGGYSTLHSLLQLRANLATEIIPETVIVAYASFHEDRNSGSPVFLRAFNSSRQITEFRYPYASIKDDSISIAYSNLEYSHFPLSDVLATVRYFQNQRDHYVESHLDSYQITKRLLEEIQGLCEQNNIDLIIAAVDDSEATTKMLAEFENSKVITLNMSVDLDDPNYGVPNDGHPNGNAHQIFAETLATVILK